jgi:hypothetical protein
LDFDGQVLDYTSTVLDFGRDRIDALSGVFIPGFSPRAWLPIRLNVDIEGTGSTSNGLPQFTI